MRHGLPGRLVCDVFISARELVRLRTYSLTELANHLLSGPESSNCATQSEARSNRKMPLRYIPKHLISQTKGAIGDEANEDEVNSLQASVDSADLRCLFANSDLLHQLIDFCLSDTSLVLKIAHRLQIFF
ncbi:unnamed protein product [Protopolystoma xenopodis]|uniref:Uncharacterized protein n=1 Tax=Protopolystoma xenopodis TaxID=117903 RepID=A0A3S5AT52_9PLAT|nr:unnamed protein product [Protopolystoma xenopodis]